jgi:hypothetical protein
MPHANSMLTPFFGVFRRGPCNKQHKSGRRRRAPEAGPMSQLTNWPRTGSRQLCARPKRTTANLYPVPISRDPHREESGGSCARPNTGAQVAKDFPVPCPPAILPGSSAHCQHLPLRHLQLTQQRPHPPYLIALHCGMCMANTAHFLSNANQLRSPAGQRHNTGNGRAKTRPRT